MLIGACNLLIAHHDIKIPKPFCIISNFKCLSLKSSIKKLTLPNRAAIMDGWTLNLFTAPRDEAETAAREMKVRAAEENIFVSV